MDEIGPQHFGSGEMLLVPGQLMLPAGPVAGHAVVIAGGVFSAIGPAEELRAKYPKLKPVELPGMLLMPGFIDAHHHLTQTFGKALAFGEPSEIFRRIWVPMEGVLDEEMVYLSSKAGALESLRGGFTTVVDAGTRAAGDASAVARATQEAGPALRARLHLQRSRPRRQRNRQTGRGDHLERWAGNELVHPSLAVSIPEVASDAMLKQVSSMCAAAGAMFQTHVNEHLVAVERSLVDRGPAADRASASSRRARTAGAAGACDADHAVRTEHAARDRYRGRLQPGRIGVEGQRGGARRS